MHCAVRIQVHGKRTIMTVENLQQTPIHNHPEISDGIQRGKWSLYSERILEDNEISLSPLLGFWWAS